MEIEDKHWRKLKQSDRIELMLRLNNGSTITICTCWILSLILISQFPFLGLAYGILFGAGAIYFVVLGWLNGFSQRKREEEIYKEYFKLEKK